MALLYFFLYVAVEIAALVWLGSTIGILSTVLLVVLTSVLGLILVRSQGRRVLGELRSASASGRSPIGAIADGGMVAAGSILMAVPGLVTSALGLLLLFPLTRAALRPIVGAVGAKRLKGAVAAGHFAPAGGGRFGPTFAAGHVVVDGEVVTDSRVSDSHPVIEGPDLRKPQD
ncbi:FxsA family protein [Actinomycetes bacterium M1A6_2h]